jgi:hypothetical protein
MSLKECKSGTSFNGVIGPTFDQPNPALSELSRARENAPNILFIMDDPGFDQMGCCSNPL